MGYRRQGSRRQSACWCRGDGRAGGRKHRDHPVVNREVDALLAVQADDAAIRAIEGKRDALTPRLSLLDATQKRAVEEVARTEAALERELSRQRVLDVRLAETRTLHERATVALDTAERLSDATTAAAQVESTRRALADGESEALALTRRVADLRTAFGAPPRGPGRGRRWPLKTD